MFLLRHGRHVCVPPKGTNMASPYKVFFLLLLFFFILRSTHLQQKTFKVKVTAPNATNLTFIVYQIQYLTTLLISPAEFSMHALN